MKYKLNVKLIFSYLLIAFLLVGITAIVTNVTLENRFKEYIIRLHEEKTTEVVDMLTKEYVIKDGFDNVNLEEIGMETLGNELIIKVMDKDNNVLWDAMEHNSGMCAQMLAEMAHNMKKYYPDFDGKYTEKEYDLKVDNEIVGSVLIGYYGPYYFTEKDIAFLQAFNKVLIVTAIISIIISICLGVIISRKISESITRVIDATRGIANGNYKNRIKKTTDTKELNDLIDSVNDLAMTLEKQEGLRKDLTSDISHELRTPIATVQSHLEALKDGVWELNKERIDALYDEIIRLSKIVKDLDKLNSFDRTEDNINITNFNLGKLLSKIIRNMENDFELKHISVTIDEVNTNILADKDKMTQVFINLLSNAIKYTNDGGQVNINVKELKNKIQITVKDNGIGIAESDLPYIFERFYRADKSRTRLTGGSGIGLSIVKNIVEEHKGSVKAISTINKGTSIIIELPR